MRVRRRLARLVAAVAAVAAVGCSAQSAPPARPFEPPPPPQPRSPLTRLAEALDQAAQRDGCGAVLVLVHSSVGPLDAETCERVRSNLEGWRNPTVRAYGTGGLIDFGGSTDRRTAVVAMDRNRAYRLLFVVDSTAALAGVTGFNTAVGRALDAIKLGDCGLFVDATHRDLGLGDGSRTQVCERFRSLDATDLLQANPRAQARRMGGDGQIEFYGLGISEDLYYTVVMGPEPFRADETSSRRPALISIVPSS